MQMYNPDEKIFNPLLGDTDLCFAAVLSSFIFQAK